ncbi:MAG: RIP metalloprotease RseP [Bryobacteraceae bacterium]|nr:RIP metalloprotease RseP [Bryobacteraceae bacterium]
MVVFENIWWLLVLIGVMIMIHELGHFWAARFFDVKVEAFSFGFGPRLFGFRRGETDFRVSLILFGGYVKMTGEQPGDESGALDPRSFQAKPRWQRLIIAAAGPFMNIVLAVALLTGMFMYKFPKPPEWSQPGTIGYVRPNSPAAEAGIEAGDRIVEIQGQQNPDWGSILVKELASARQPLSVVIERDGKRIPFTVTPVLDERLGIAYAGWSEEVEIEIFGFVEGTNAQKSGLEFGDVIVSVNGNPMRSVGTLVEAANASQGKPVEIIFSRDGERHRVVVEPTLKDVDGEKRYLIGIQPRQKMVYTQLPLTEALAESVRQNISYATLIYRFLEGIVERRMSARSLEGPIRIAQLSGDAAREGPFAFIGLMAMVSLNLAVFNLLPIPILDGGVILLLLVEMLMRRDLSMPVKEAIIKVGFVFLMLVVAFVLYNDLSKVLPRGSS